MSAYIDFDFSTKGLAINLANGVIISDNEGLLVCKLIETQDISNNSITLPKLDPSILTHFVGAVQIGNVEIGLFNTLRTNINLRSSTIPIMQATSTQIMTQGIMFLQAFYLLTSNSITSAGVYVNSTVAGMSCQLAIYNKTGAQLAISSVATTIGSAGLITFTFATFSPPTTEMYYFAFLAPTTNSSNIVLQSGISNAILNIGIPTPDTGSLGYVAQTYGSNLNAMPSTLTLAVSASSVPTFITI